jgi:hypothetical protein
MMVDNSLATCRTCGRDVPILDLLSALPTDHNTVAISWRHQVCGGYAEREISRQTALALHHRIIGDKHVRSTEEIMLEEWGIDLGGELTMSVFENQWAPRRH